MFPELVDFVEQLVFEQLEAVGPPSVAKDSVNPFQASLPLLSPLADFGRLGP